MLRAHLESPFGSDNRDLEAAYFRITGKSLYAPDGLLLAVHADGMWQGQAGELYTALQFSTDVTVSFVDPAAPTEITLGVCQRLRIVGGSMWHVDGRHELIARLDDKSAAWHILAQAGSVMPACIIRPA